MIFDTIEEIRKELERRNQEKLRIAIFGQAGAGKSSLINAIVGQDLAEVSPRTDTTVADEPYEWGELVLMDLPGYGTEKFPKEGYWERFVLSEYDLFICVFAGKLHEADNELFRLLHEKGKGCIFVRNQVDTLFQLNKTPEQLKADICGDLKKQIGRESNIIFTSCRTGEGLDQVTQAIAERLDETKKAAWLRNAQAFTKEHLLKKKMECGIYVQLAAALSAVNGLNPVPVLDVTVDVTVLIQLANQLKQNFGLNDDRLNAMLTLEKYAHAAQLIKNLLKAMSGEGIIALLKGQLTKLGGKTIFKYTPVIGPLISSGIGYTLTIMLGSQILEECYTVAERIMKDELSTQRTA